MRKTHTYLNLLIIYGIFLIIAIFVKGKGDDEFIKIVLSISTFIFAIVLAFSTANRHKRLGAIRNALRKEDAFLINIYYLSKVFSKKIINGLKKKIDEYVISTIDYDLVDYDKSTPKFLKLYGYVVKIKAKTSRQVESKDSMLDEITDAMKNNKEITYWVSDKMMPFEWASLTALGGIIIFCLFYLNTNSLISIIFIPIVATALALLLLILDELNSLQWQEKNWVWKPLAALFQELNLIPYFHKDLFDSKRLKHKHLKHLKKYRIGDHPNWPDTSKKTVVTAKNK